jgi:sec-independent protein translocase protein TatA
MHLLVILAVFVLFFGGKKLPELAKGLGEGIKNFKTAMRPDGTTPPNDEKKPTDQA